MMIIRKGTGEHEGMYNIRFTYPTHYYVNEEMYQQLVYEVSLRKPRNCSRILNEGEWFLNVTIREYKRARYRIQGDKFRKSTRDKSKD